MNNMITSTRHERMERDHGSATSAPSTASREHRPGAESGRPFRSGSADALSSSTAMLQIPIAQSFPQFPALPNKNRGRLTCLFSEILCAIPGQMTNAICRIKYT